MGKGDRMCKNECLLHAVGLGMAYVHIHRLIEYWGGIDQINAMPFREIASAEGVHPKLAEQLLNPRLEARLESGLLRAEQLGWQWTSWSDPSFPERLRSCEDAPLLLFYKGQPAWNTTAALAVVGTRRAHPSACDWVDLQLKQFKRAEVPLTVVSGLAYGIDIAAHRACLKHRIPTFAVLAHGPDDLYPRHHGKEAVALQQQGALITEFFPSTPPVPRNFLQRNRIVAGMCDATWVVASAKKGGALVTADIAHSYERTVWASPGLSWDDAMLGCNEMIRSQKAVFMLEASDIALGMNWPWKDRPEGQLSLDFEPAQGETPAQKKIHLLLKAHGLLSLDELGWALQVPLSELLSDLLLMELAGWIETLPGARYRARAG